MATTTNNSRTSFQAFDVANDKLDAKLPIASFAISGGGSGIDNGTVITITGVKAVKYGKDGEEPTEKAKTHLVFTTSHRTLDGNEFLLSTTSFTRPVFDISGNEVTRDGSADAKIIEAIRNIMANPDRTVREHLNTLLAALPAGTTRIRARRKGYTGINAFGKADNKLSVLCWDLV